LPAAGFAAVAAGVDTGAAAASDVEVLAGCAFGEEAASLAPGSGLGAGAAAGCVLTGIYGFRAARRLERQYTTAEPAITANKVTSTSLRITPPEDPSSSSR